MQGTLTLISEAGLISDVGVTNPRTYKEIKKLLNGGMLQLIPHFDTYNNKPCHAYCDDEGKIKQLPINEFATILWMTQLPSPIDDVLVGPIVIVTGDDEFMAAQ